MLISCKDITVQIGSQRLFENTSWELQRNQRWAIIGTVGSGKSILGKALSGKAPLVQGEIDYYFDENNITQGRPYLYPNEILTLSSETHRAFLNRYTGYHQARWQSFEGEESPTVSELLTAVKLAPVSDAEPVPSGAHSRMLDQKRDWAASLFKLEDLLNRKIVHCSHGESRKVFLASLLIRCPKLLILDDPFAGLDQDSRGKLSQVIEQLTRLGDPHMVFISSRPEEIPEEITDILFIQNHRVKEEGDRATILNSSAVKSVFSRTASSRLKIEGSAALDEIIQEYRSAVEKQTTATAEFIRLDAVNVTYGKEQVLKNIHWTVRQGERWALLGANGAGKTTLLSLILADNPQAYANPIYLFGEKRGSGESIWEIKQKIGAVSPELQIFYDPNASCLDVICSGFFDSVGLTRASSAQQRALAARWLQALDLEGLAAMRFDRLSAGQQRLVLFARALVKNPPLVILDEPCQGLDPLLRSSFVALIDRLCAQTPITLIYVTHNANEIPQGITHQLRLERGSVREIIPLPSRS
jgi:molybdate transport system ATP-binding protein